MLRGFLMSFLLSSFFLASAQVPVGLVTMASNHDFDTTVANLEAAIEASPLNLFAIVDHAANAANNDLELRPTKVFLFGNPNVGTPLMQTAQSVAIDLPQKMLVWQAEDGSVHVGFNNPYYLQSRHNIEGHDQRITNINNALTGLAKKATE